MKAQGGWVVANAASSARVHHHRHHHGSSAGGSGSFSLRHAGSGSAVGAVPSLPDGVSLIELDELQLQHRIGAGASATTYLAAWQGAHVAVKVASDTGSAKEGWRAEVAALAQLHHPNVVRCMGAVAAPPTYCVVLEHCEGGDVRHALQRKTSPGFFWRVAEGVVSGMGYLHHRGIIHRDIKSANILLDGTSGVKLTDFGLSSRQLGDSGAAGTFRWMAPEVARREGHSKPADMYSNAMVLYELLTHDLPFAGSSGVFAAAHAAINGARPGMPEGTPPSVAAMITRCWSSEPSERPTFEALGKELTNVRAHLSGEELDWLDAEEGHAPPQPPPQPLAPTVSQGVALPPLQALPPPALLARLAMEPRILPSSDSIGSEQGSSG